MCTSASSASIKRSDEIYLLLQRMMERAIDKRSVIDTIEKGEIVKHYPDDRPYPSYLRCSIISGRPIHVVYAVDEDEDSIIVITAYEPDKNLWDETFTKRKK